MEKSIFLLSALMTLNLGAFAQNSVFQFSGKVKDANGKGIAGVVVNNGVRFTQTDKEGKWSLPTDTCLSKFVSISTPSAYELPQKDGLASGFYVSTGELVRTKNTHDFVLNRRNKLSDDFHYIAISDPQVKNEEHFGRWTSEAVPAIRHTVDSLSKTGEVVGVALGDLVWDNMPLMDNYKASCRNLGMTMFQCIGNHDFNLLYQDLHNMPYGTPVYAEKEYNEHFGPTEYSFNIGKVHVVTLKNINYTGYRSYVEALTMAEIEWLKNDLKYVPKGSTVLVNMHAAAWNKVAAEGNIRDYKEFDNALRGYRVHVFAGHTHYFQNNLVRPDLMEHNIGAACGAWWVSDVNRCGSPNGYLILDVKGNDVKWHYKPTKGSVNEQMRVYGRGEFPGYRRCVVANVWDADTLCKVQWLEDGRMMGDMKQFVGADPDYASTLKPGKEVCVTGHLFACNPSPTAKEVKVVFTNQFGEEYVQRVPLTVSGVVDIVAHRGYWKTDSAAQNGLVSLRKAAEVEAYASEFDVQMTKDGVPVVCHDPKTDGKVIADNTWKDMSKVLLGNGEALPCLNDFLDEAAKLPQLKLVFEIKKQADAEKDSILTDKCVKMVLAKKMLQQVEFISFGQNICDQIRTMLPEAIVYTVGGEMSPKQAKEKKMNGLDYNYKVFLKHPKWVAEAHSLGLKVNAWTADDPANIKAMADMHVDFITTNEPAKAREWVK